MQHLNLEWLHVLCVMTSRGYSCSAPAHSTSCNRCMFFTVPRGSYVSL